MIKRIGLVLVSMLVFCEGYSQNPLVKQWDYRFGGTDYDQLMDIKETPDSGVILVGPSWSQNNGNKTQPNWDPTSVTMDYWVVKLNKYGGKQWDRRFGGPSSDWPNCVEVTKDNGYIVVGFTYSDSIGDVSQHLWGGGDGWAVKIDSLGNKQWDRRYGGSYFDNTQSIEQTSDGGYIIGGSSVSDSSGDKSENNWDPSHQTPDYWIIKVDSMGNKQWDKRFGGLDADEFHSVQQTADGGYILGGQSRSGIGGDKTQDNLDPTYVSYDFWIVKTDSVGNKQWEKRFGGLLRDYFVSLKKTLTNGFIFGGFSESGIGGEKTQVNCSAPFDDYWIVQTDSAGNKIWDIAYGGNNGQDEFGNIALTQDGNYLLAGTSYSHISCYKSENNLGLEQMWILKIAPSGAKIWDKTVFTAGHDEIGFAVNTKDNCYVFANFMHAGMGGYKTQSNWDPTGQTEDIWVVKFCDTTSTTSITQLTNAQLPFSISPNPTTGTIQLTFNTKHNGAVMCEIMNVMGERVFSSPAPLTPKGESSAQLDVSFLAKGIYLVRVGDAEHWESKKLVVE